MKIKKLLNNSAFKTGAVLAVAFLWACGEPLEPSPNGWHIAYDGMPGDRLAVSGGDIFTVKALEGLGQTNTIYKFDGVKVTADFVGNPEYKFNDVAFRGTPGWAGGYKETTPPLYEKPVLVRREGAMWREENLPASEVKAIDRVYPISGNSCWLLIHTYSPLSLLDLFY